MTRLSSRTRHILELARDQDHPEPAAITRVERALSRRIALGAAGAGGAAMVGGGATTAKAATGTAMLLTVAKSAGIAGVVATLGLLAYRAGEPGPAVPSGATQAVPLEQRAPGDVGLPPRKSAAVTSPSRDDTESAASELAVSPAAPEARRPAKQENATVATGAVSPPRRVVEPQAELSGGAKLAPANAASKPALPDRLVLETRALREAQRALRGGEPERALGLLDEQDGRFAGGALGQERAAARVMALCQSGRAERARHLAARFEQSVPGSPLIGRVRSACADEPLQSSRAR